MAPLVDLARADLAARLGVDPGAIAIVDARAVVWPDRGAGCPQPGLAYQQVPTEGVFISLRAGGATYNYHGREGRDPVYCPTSAGPPPAGAPAGPGSGGEP